MCDGGGAVLREGDLFVASCSLSDILWEWEHGKKEMDDSESGYFCFVAFMPFLIWVPQMLASWDTSLRKKYVRCVPCPWKKTQWMCRTYIDAGMLTGGTELLSLLNGGFPDCLLCFIFLPACHQSCFGCAGKSPHNCTACWPSHVLLDGQCLSQCPDGYFNLEGSCTGEYVTCWGIFPVPMFYLHNATRLSN